ncbi:DUF429 domain-containing protein [Chthonobacter rhizosphaerae]|uniref:DUF429 domain-containing protein n=1 Tax=Chthonobacter rhizosphaerae TaxID=2735553 RepID=UPI0015EF0998|nr:DUF429 domain-containing protein [Chthonobacter rhizosphaerae]
MTNQSGDVVIVGFDAAWTDHPKKPGAICSVRFQGGRCTAFHPPRLVSFGEGLAFIEEVEVKGVPVLVALDQPTVVPNATGSRPVDKIAATLVSWIGGGVQPANRSKLGMFDDEAPVWQFLEALGAIQHPEEARTASSGRYLIEVFPALALTGLDSSFFGRLAGPRYNPERRKTFQQDHWRRVLVAVSAEARRLGCEAVADWLPVLDVEPVRKPHQDLTDAVICLLIGIRWRLEPRESSIVIGCTDRGYMVAPVTPPIYDRLSAAALLRGVPIDQPTPSNLGSPA